MELHFLRMPGPNYVNTFLKKVPFYPGNMESVGSIFSFLFFLMSESKACIFTSTIICLSYIKYYELFNACQKYMHTYNHVERLLKSGT